MTVDDDGRILYIELRNDLNDFPDIAEIWRSFGGNWNPVVREILPDVGTLDVVHDFSQRFDISWIALFPDRRDRSVLQFGMKKDTTVESVDFGETV